MTDLEATCIPAPAPTTAAAPLTLQQNTGIILAASAEPAEDDVYHFAEASVEDALFGRGGAAENSQLFGNKLSNKKVTDCSVRSL